MARDCQKILQLYNTFGRYLVNLMSRKVLGLLSFVGGRRGCLLMMRSLIGSKLGLWSSMLLIIRKIKRIMHYLNQILVSSTYNYLLIVPSKS